LATIDERPGNPGLLVGLLTSDFCPGLNRYVYWLKEPIGWFVLATAVSGIVGQWVNPVGWTIAVSLLAIMAAGVVWPWIAVRAVVCQLRPELEAVHEGEPCRMLFSVHNRLPLPVWGLAVEGYLDCKGDQSMPTVGLASVPPLCSADYPILIRPELRGRYPVTPPRAVCAFPFGIWTARRELLSCTPLMVWPRVYPIAGHCPFIGPTNAESGEGLRGGRSGDFVGVRPFRRGDSPKHIHWAHLARTDQWIITERGGPQCVELEVILDPSGRSLRSQWNDSQARESLAWRVRVAASILVAVRQESIPIRIRLGDQPLVAARGPQGTRRLLDQLAEIPADGLPWIANHDREPSGNGRTVQIQICRDERDAARVRIDVWDPHGGRRAGGGRMSHVVDCCDSMEGQLQVLWRELGDVTQAA